MERVLQSDLGPIEVLYCLAYIIVLNIFLASNIESFVAWLSILSWI
jgi:hypothetical protein